MGCANDRSVAESETLSHCPLALSTRALGIGVSIDASVESALCKKRLGFSCSDQTNVLKQAARALAADSTDSRDRERGRSDGPTVAHYILGCFPRLSGCE